MPGILRDPSRRGVREGSSPPEIARFDFQLEAARLPGGRPRRKDGTPRAAGSWPLWRSRGRTARGTSWA